MKSSSSAERKLHDALASSLDLAVVKVELKMCKQQHQSCTYVARTVYRFLPEIKNQGSYRELLSIYLNADIINEFDWYLLTGQLKSNVLFQ